MNQKLGLFFGITTLVLTAASTAIMASAEMRYRKATKKEAEPEKEGK